MVVGREEEIQPGVNGDLLIIRLGKELEDRFTAYKSMYRDDEVANQLPDNLSKNAIENRVEDRVMISSNIGIDITGKKLVSH
ncbi:hypothetical protein RCL_jg27601.t1 [Rhizophagus clarus]|uniref:Uncharacterized protein n=1 Tax=Rhizophagus clarus TaxID=94130 RepID=A0A8H3LZN4_9GLOM|nr:hypothetical protein RCL_jg27601.t1 [Rhizophagus clarus]